MKKFLNSGNARLYVLLLSLLALAGAWRAGEAIVARLAALQVKEVPRVDRGAFSIDAHSFYPVWVKQAAATPPAPSADGGASLDTLFQAREESKRDAARPPAPREPDYVQMFKQAASVDGVADDGAFINGRFYSIGRKMDDFAMAGPGGRVVPVIESIGGGRITFRIGHKQLVFVTGSHS